MANSPLIGMEMLAESQAGKYLLINKNFRILETLQNNSAKSSTLSAQPDAPDDGDTYILPASPTGAQWSLFNEDSIAIYLENSWHEVAPNARARYEFDIADETDTWRSWNGIAWVVGRMAIGTGNGTGNVVTAYRYIRLRITEAIAHSAGFQIAIMQRVHLRNASSTDIAESSTVTASSTYSGYSAATVVSTAAGNWANGAALDQSLTFDLGAGNTEVVETYEIQSAADGGNAPYYPVSWILEGSDDNVTYTELDSQTGQTFTMDQTKGYSVAATSPVAVDPIKGIRLFIESNHGGTFTKVDELQFRQAAGVGVNHVLAGDVAFASSVYSSNAVHQAAAAFDGLITTSIWASANAAVFPQFVGLLLGVPTTDPFVELYIDNGALSTAIPNDCKVQISTDTTDLTDGTWTDVAPVLVAYTAGVQTFALSLSDPVTSVNFQDFDVGTFTDVTPIATSGTVSINSPASLAFNLANISAGNNGLAAEASNPIILADGDAFELEADWQCALSFYQPTATRWLAVGLLQEPFQYHTGQWFYSNPYRVASNQGIGFWFGPLLRPEIMLDSVAQTGIASVQWDAQSLADLLNPTNVKFNVVPESTADSKVSIWLDGNATPDEHVITGWRPSGTYKLIVWVSDYASTKAINVTNIALRKS